MALLKIIENPLVKMKLTTIRKKETNSKDASRNEDDDEDM